METILKINATFFPKKKYGINTVLITSNLITLNNFGIKFGAFLGLCGNW